MAKKSAFSKFANYVSQASGKPIAAMLAVAVVVVWAVSGPMFDFSETWQLVINTGTTIITFLMVFVIQHTQNKDTMAIQLKLDELIRSTGGAHNALIDLEELEDFELIRIRKRYLQLAMEARQRLREGKTDCNKPEVKEDFDIG